MSEIKEICQVVDDFKFKKGDYLGAEEQLSKFAENYVKLCSESADILRHLYDGKDRLGWFRVATTLFHNSFLEADDSHKDKLLKIFFALYSFDNLGYGYDSVIDVISVSNKLKDYQKLAKNNWTPFKRLTTNILAQKNLENHIFIQSEETAQQ